jgi:hypothetical protein
MTKARDPLSFELALTRVAGRVGWDVVASIAAHSERTIRNWSDPDTGPAAAAAISLDLALKLDVAYRANGGEGAPMLQCYSTRLETETAAALADVAAIAHSAAIAAKESGEAIAAAIAAAQVGASPAQLAAAELELEQVICAFTDTLARIRAGRGASGPEVPPFQRVDPG